MADMGTIAKPNTPLQLLGFRICCWIEHPFPYKDQKPKFGILALTVI